MNAERLAQDYAGIINKALEGKPADMVVTTHICRGNFRSTWISEGGYEPVAEVLLGQLNYDGYFLEYDTERAGGFEPLRFLPKGNKIVVLGLITTKSGQLEKKDDVKRRIEEATKYAALDQLSLVTAVRFCLDRRRQRAGGGGAMGKAPNGGRACRRGLGLRRSPNRDLIENSSAADVPRYITIKRLCARAPRAGRAVCARAPSGSWRIVASPD